MYVNATDVKNNFGFYLEMLSREDVIVLRNGKPFARLTAHKEWEQGLRLGDAPAEYGYEDASEPDEMDGKQLTYSQFMKFYEKTDKRYEYIDGRAWLMGAPTEQHQRIIGNLHARFYNFLKGKPCRVYLAPLDVYLGSRSTDRNVVQPDILVVCDMANFNDKGRYIGAPTLAIEVLSPSNRSHDLIRKMDLYLRSGVQEYWTIDGLSALINIYQFDQDQIVSQRTFSGSDELRSSCIEGLIIPVPEVFE